MVKTIVYRSRAVYPMHENQLLDILHSSCIHNAALGITGVLLYAEGNFIQCLEGRAAFIDTLYSRILADQRHTDIETLINETIEERSFVRWCMGFSLTDAGKIENLPGYLSSIDELELELKSNKAVSAISAFIESHKMDLPG